MQHIFLNGEDVSEEIRTEIISRYASAVSTLAPVREYLLELQRGLARDHDVIMDGRDIGTVILPHAQVKIFLSATPECRARRRYKELVEKGQTVTYEDVLADVNRRDYQDSHREIAPLKPSADSIMADTSELDLQQSTDLIINIIREHTK